MTAANVFYLSGGRIHLAYSTGAEGSLNRLEYRDGAQTLQFSDNDIRILETDMGRVVSVTIHTTVDSGSTSFSVIVPRTNLDPNSNVPIQTYGVTAVHRFSVVEVLNKGELDILSMTRLHGVASLSLG